VAVCLIKAVGLLASFICLFRFPELVIAVSLLAHRVVRWRILPAGWRNDVSLTSESLTAHGRDCGDLARHLVLPVVDFGAVLKRPSLSVMCAPACLKILGAPYVASGAWTGHQASPARLLFRQVLPAAANPAISLLGFSVAGLLSGSLIVEAVCGWPGLGPAHSSKRPYRATYSSRHRRNHAFCAVHGRWQSCWRTSCCIAVGSAGFAKKGRMGHRLRGRTASDRCRARRICILCCSSRAFVAPYDPTTQNRELSYAPPTRLHFIDDSSGFHLPSRSCMRGQSVLDG
jgi:hypothetical protein